MGGAVAHAAIDQILRRPKRLLFSGASVAAKANQWQFVQFETVDGLKAALGKLGADHSRHQVCTVA